MLIASAFLTSFPLGLVTTFAVAAHEIPHRVGDFAILVHSGMSRGRALVMNMATGLTSVVGGWPRFSACNGRSARCLMLWPWRRLVFFTSPWRD